MCAKKKKTNPTAYDQFVSYVLTVVKASMEMTVNVFVCATGYWILHKDTFHACADTFASQSHITDHPPGETVCFINHCLKATSITINLYIFVAYS